MVSVESRRGLVRAGKGHCRLMPGGGKMILSRPLSLSLSFLLHFFRHYLSLPFFHLAPSFTPFSFLLANYFYPLLPLMTISRGHWDNRSCHSYIDYLLLSPTNTEQVLRVTGVLSSVGTLLRCTRAEYMVESRLSSGKSYAYAGHQGNENGSYYVTEQGEALDVIENSIPFNTRFIRLLSDGRLGPTLLKLSASEKNVTSKLHHIRGTRELYSHVLHFMSRELLMHFYLPRIYILLFIFTTTSIRILTLESYAIGDGTNQRDNLCYRLLIFLRVIGGVRSIIILELWPSSMEVEIVNWPAKSDGNVDGSKALVVVEWRCGKWVS